MEINANIPECFEFLFEPHAAKVAYGGRGAGKSWAFARALIIKAIQKPTRILCAREIQKSITESVHHLLCDQINTLGVANIFRITDHSILCNNGSEFIFEGLFRNVNKIRSLEGVDILWIEEAHAVSEESWQLVLPTIREDNSEVWVSFNTNYDTDATYQRYVLNPPPDSVVKLINYDSNPYFPDTLRRQMEYDRGYLDSATFRNIWHGEPKRTGGRVWPGFDKAVHVDRVKDIPQVSLANIARVGNAYAGIDPHAHYYPACVFGAVVPKNERKRWPEDFYFVIYDEYPSKTDLGGYYADLRHKVFYTKTLADFGRTLKSKQVQNDGTQDYEIPLIKRFIDTRFAAGSGGTNWSTNTVGLVQEMAKTENGGIELSLPPIPALTAMRGVLHTQMQYNTLISVSAFNEPSLLVYGHCHNLIQSLTNHRLEEGCEKEDDRWKDMSDALRLWRAGISECKYIPPKEVYDVDDSDNGYNESDWMGA
jgi:hypothetical protein